MREKVVDNVKGKSSTNSSNLKNHSNNKNISNRFLPNSLRIIGSCIKTVSANATLVASTVKSAAASISNASHDKKEQVTWAGFDKLELNESVCRHVLLLGYNNGFQVFDVEDASNFCELVSKRDGGPVTFLQMQPIPFRSNHQEGFYKSHPLLLVVGGDETHCSEEVNCHDRFSGLENDDHRASGAGKSASLARAVHFYSLRSHSFVHLMRFRSDVCMVRCSPLIVAVGLAKQIYCLDALTLKTKFSVLTHPVPQVVGHGKVGVNIGCGPMAVGPRWLAYASNDSAFVKTGRLNAQALIPSPGDGPSILPGSGVLVAHYALESGKHLAAGIVNIGDKGYKTLSKYCQELLPDGVDSFESSCSENTRAVNTESDNAGVVAVMDFKSRTIICQFRAHSTPISALCFDPSGTLLVTASVNGNSINVFRIMPCCDSGGSGFQSYNWRSSCVHLYRFHRGIRAAIITDICFSRFSQWVAVVSSKGTCHLFVLSPFGGDVGFHSLNDHGGERFIAPVLTFPWWSTTACTLNQQSVLPPSPVTLSVVSRIKDNKSGLLNTVSSAAASVSGKASVPSGAIAAVFHNSIPFSTQHAQMPVRVLEHLLVFTPSGHVVQHEIQSSFSVECSGDSKFHSNSLVNIESMPVGSSQSQDELNIHICPNQWWDVCRRPNWPEREDFVPEMFLQGPQASVVYGNRIFYSQKPGISKGNTTVGRNMSMRTDTSRSHKISDWYLSKAEVQDGSKSLLATQKSKISFFVFGLRRCENNSNGEFEIEKFAVFEVEMRRKDLLPVFDHFHSMKSAFHDSGATIRRCSNSFDLDSSNMKDNIREETVICHSKHASSSSTESSNGGSSRRTDQLLHLDHLDRYQAIIPHNQTARECGHGNSVNDISEGHSFDNELGPEKIKHLHGDFPSCTPVAKVNSAEAKVSTVEIGSASFGVLICKNASPDIDYQNEASTSPLHDCKGNSADMHGHRSTSSVIHEFVSSDVLIQNACSNIPELVAAPDEIKDTDTKIVDDIMDLRRNNSVEEQYLPCPIISCIDKGHKEKKYESQEMTLAQDGVMTCINPSFKEDNFSEEEDQNKCGPLIDLSEVGEEPAECVRTTESSVTTVTVSCDNSFMRGTCDQEGSHLLGLMFPFINVGDQNILEQAVEDSDGAMLNFCRNINTTTVSSREQSGDEAAGNSVISGISSAEDTFVQPLQDKLEDLVQGGPQTATEAATVSSQSCVDSSINYLNQDNGLKAVGSLSCLLGETGEASEPAVCQKNTEDVSNTSVSKVDGDEEENILGALAHLAECRDVASSLSRADDWSEDEDDTLGAIFNSCEYETDHSTASLRKDVFSDKDGMLGAICPFPIEG